MSIEDAQYYVSETKQFISYDGPILCEFETIDEICLPLVKPGHALDDMLLADEYNSKFLKLNGEAPC